MSIRINLEIGSSRPKDIKQQDGHGSPRRVRSHKRKIWPVFLALTLVVLIAGGGYWLHSSRSNDNKGLDKAARLQFIDQQKFADFPVYYPATPPEGYKIDPSSIMAQGQTFSFTAMAPNGTKLVVIEQARPPVMEQVTKIKDVTTGIGKAYVADLNGQKAGFIIGKKTLITISAANADGNQITALIQSLKLL